MEKNMTPERPDIDELKRLHEAATPTPWVAHNPDDSMHMNMLCITHADISEPDCEDDLKECVAVTLLQTPIRVGSLDVPWDENTELIASVRNALPHLIAYIEALEQAARRQCDRPERHEGFRTAEHLHYKRFRDAEVVGRIADAALIHNVPVPEHVKEALAQKDEK